jgi:hypothetical protein
MEINSDMSAAYAQVTRPFVDAHGSGTGWEDETVPGFGE